MTFSQIALNVHLREQATFENYLVGENEQLLACLRAAANGRGEKFIYLWGDDGLGRTHLLQACCHATTELGLKAFYLSFQGLEKLSPSVLENVETVQLICLDDLHRIQGHPEWEEAVFDCFNRIREAGKRLIVTANGPPKELGLQLPDLASRLSMELVFPLRDLDDDAKLQALIMQARQRGIKLPYEVAQFIYRRASRGLGSLFSLLDTLDRASLEAKRPLTVPFVKSVLKI